MTRPRNCDVCKSGWYGIPNSQICMTQCPTGFSPSAEGVEPAVCTADTTDDKVFCLEFDDVIGENFTDSISGIAVVGEGEKP